MQTDKVLVGDDRRMMVLADKSAPEKQAREKVRIDNPAGGFKWFGLAPAAQRGKSARPAETYRGARRNAARDAKKDARRRERAEAKSE